MRQEEDSEVAIQAVGMLPECLRVKGLHGIQLNLSPAMVASLQQQGMSPG